MLVINWLKNKARGVLKKKGIIGLIIITVVILLIWTQWITRWIKPEALEWNQKKTRLEMADEIAFMKDNWDNLSSAKVKSKLSDKLKSLDLEVILYDRKQDEFVFVHGQYANKVVRGNASEILGLNDQATVDGGNYKQLTWLIYRRESLLGVARIYIPYKVAKNPYSRLKSRILLSGLGICIGLLVVWFFTLYRKIIQKDKVIDKLNSVVKKMSQGDLSTPIKNIEFNDDIRESLILLDRMRQDLRDMILAKEEHEKSRKLLINYLMHDIRTPLASMRALTEGLLDGVARTEEAKTTYYKGLERKIGELEKLTDDLFHHVNIEVGALVVNLEEVYCDKAMIPVLKWLTTLQSSFSGTLEINYEIPHVIVKLDTKRMEQALMNLITNGIKYSEEKGIIKVGVTKEEDMVVFLVKDNGLGISKEDLPFVFQHFYRGEKSRSRKHGGTGLGLSIVKYIVEAHEGYVKVNSELGSGTTFKIYLPII